MRKFDDFDEFDDLNNESNTDEIFKDFPDNKHVFEDGKFVKEEVDYNPVEQKKAKEESNMKKVKENNKKNNRYKVSKDFLKIIGLTISGLLLVLSLLTMAKSFVPAQKNETLILSYNVDSSVDYRVNLIENDFYETTALGKGELVPVSFIDDIVIDFSGYLSANKQLNINYNYKITGEITATASDNGKENSGGKIWTKNYTFVPSKSLSQSAVTGYNINEKVIIDYEVYNDLVNQYKLQASIPMEAELTVTLKVDANSNVEGKALNDSSSVSVKIPLSVSTVMIDTTDADTATKTLVNTEEIPASKNYVLLAISVVILLGSLVATIYLLKSLRRMTEDHSLLLKFNKIMRDYNQVIIEIEELPEVKDAAIIEVKTFKDMLDIQKELHVPIMCSKSKEDILTDNMFYIVNQNQVFKYRLNAEPEKF